MGNSPAFLWVYVVYASVSIAMLLAWGVRAALDRSGAPDARPVGLAAAAIVGAWFLLALGLAGLGAYRSTSGRLPLLFPLGVGLPIAAGVLLIRGRRGSALLRAVPPHWLIAFQAYRGLGSIFLLLMALGFLPSAFALPAGFGDVAVGLLALPVAAAAAAGGNARRPLIVAWNLLGLADLAVAITMGFLTAPHPLQQFGFDRPNTLIGDFPMVLIPTFAVPLSIVLHLASLTQLWQDRRPAMMPPPAAA
jgi:hypothetical protein